MIEQALDWYRRIHGLRFAALRYFNAAGSLPGRGEDHRPESHFIPLVLQTALGKRAEVRIFGTDYDTPDGTCIRDYIHIADLIDAHLLALTALETRDRLIYNLGNGEGYSVLDVVQTCEQIAGTRIAVVEKPRRPGDPPRLVAAAGKAKRELGWAPQFPRLEPIIASAWAWHTYGLLREEGFFLGSTSGTNVAAAIRVARDLGPGHTIVTILCDGGHKYVSRFYNSEWLETKGLLQYAG